ncbi:MAG: AAA family ATPase [Lachnospiraceae bacterium]|nr:AAA family ATPase [Lachnospiraceae bacterium]
MANRVFDFDSEPTPQEVEGTNITYKLTYDGEETASVFHPLFVLDMSKIDSIDISSDSNLRGHFYDFKERTAFVVDQNDTPEILLDLYSVDSRFIDLITWLSSNRIYVRLTVSPVVIDGSGYIAVTEINEVAYGSGAKLSAADGFLQFMIERLLQSQPGTQEVSAELNDVDEMKLTSIQSISDFLACAGSSLPANIRAWAVRNLAVARSSEISQEDKRHAQRALSIMLNIKWKGDYFKPIDPVEARRILDAELYGMDSLKQRIIETIIQINRTHKLPAYGILLAGPAGTGKSQVAYAIARILNLPWASLDMSSINDPEQLTGSPRIYANARPGIIMDAFSQAGESNIVFIINELDKANSGNDGGDPSDVLLTLLDNLGYTDNYMECRIPTSGVYPIATANDKSNISQPLMTRFAVIDIPDYTADEKKTILLKFSLPKILKRLDMKEAECIITDEAASAIVEHFKNQPGIRDLEQAAERLAANALYQIETNGAKSVTFDAKTALALL